MSFHYTFAPFGPLAGFSVCLIVLCTEIFGPRVLMSPPNKVTMKPDIALQQLPLLIIYALFAFSKRFMILADEYGI